MPMAFGLVLDGYILAGDTGGTMNVLAPGELFCLPQYIAQKQDRMVVLKPIEGQRHATILAFHQNTIACLNLPEIASPAGNL